MVLCESMTIGDLFKRWFKLRFAILYPFGIFILLYAVPDDSSLRLGISFSLSGLFLRIWANGYAIKLSKLTTSGPYAFVRHPLYLGTMLIALGFVIMLKLHFIGILLLVIMAAIYWRTIEKEEAMLEEKFKDRYAAYKKKVPAIVPTLFGYKEGEKWSFSFRRFIQSQEYKLFIWMIVLVIVFHLKEEFLIDKESLDAKNISLIICALFLASIDLAGEFIKLRRKKRPLAA